MIVYGQLYAKVDHRRAYETTNRKVGFFMAYPPEADCEYTKKRPTRMILAGRVMSYFLN